MRYVVVCVTAYLEGNARMAAAVEAHMWAQLGNLPSHPSVAAAVRDRGLELHGRVYDMGQYRIHHVGTGSEA